MLDRRRAQDSSLHPSVVRPPGYLPGPSSQCQSHRFSELVDRRRSRSRTEGGDHDRECQSMCKSDTYQAKCARQKGVSDDRTRANEDEDERPDEFGKDRRHVLFADLAPLLISCQTWLSIVWSLTSLFVAHVVAHVVSFLVISSGRSSCVPSLSLLLTSFQRLPALLVSLIAQQWG